VSSFYWCCGALLNGSWYGQMMGKNETSRYQVVCYVPESHTESVKQAMFAAGAGQFNGYSHCCWQTRGTAQFMPDESANPYIGHQHERSQLTEIKLEIYCDRHCLAEVVQAMKISHPYEVPAFGVFAMVEVD
jgi:hypothetical protein|tara:strand:- start:1676 stop:2071 length:396 start_codon:yes stop_codon:yes gene_type:complete